MRRFSVIGGNASQDLARKIAKKLKAEYIPTKLRVFPDGESKITFTKKPSKDIIVVQSTYPPVDSNLIQAFSIISKAKKFSENVIAVVPYLGYARQDREFLPGEIVTIQTIGQIFKTLGVKKIIVVDIHSTIGLKLFKIKTRNISAVLELAKHVSKMNLRDPMVVSPDMGGAERAKSFAKYLKADFIALKKHRDRTTGRVEIKSSDLKEISGRDMILVDDMISTGGSIIKATKFLKKQKCGRIFVACTHALLLDNAEKKIRRVGVSKIISTNTVPGKNSVVDVSGIITKALL